MKVKMELWVGKQEQKSIFSKKGTRNYFGKKYFYTIYVFLRNENWKHIGSYLGFSHLTEKANKCGGYFKNNFIMSKAGWQVVSVIYENIVLLEVPFREVAIDITFDYRFHALSLLLKGLQFMHRYSDEYLDNWRT